MNESSRRLHTFMNECTSSKRHCRSVSINSTTKIRPVRNTLNYQKIRHIQKCPVRQPIRNITTYLPIHSGNHQIINDGIKEVSPPQIKALRMCHKRIDIRFCPSEVNVIDAFLQQSAHTCGVLHAHGRLRMCRIRHITEQINLKRNLLVRISDEVIPIAPFHAITPYAKKTGAHLPAEQSLRRTACNSMRVGNAQELR